MISEKTIALLEKIEERTGKTPSALAKYRDSQKRAAGDNSTRTGRFLASTANAMVGNFGDEALDWLGATETAEGVRNRASRLREENPGLALLGDVVGFAAPGGVISKAVGLGTKGISAGSRIARGTTAGTIEGAAFEAGNADGQSASERVDDALTGAALGGTIGGVLGTGGAIMQRLLKNKPDGTVEPNDDQATEFLAGVLRVDKKELLDSFARGETAEQIALRSADGDVNLANQILIPLRQGDKRVQGALGRRAERAVDDVSREIVDESSTVVDDLTARSTADELSPNAQREFSQANVTQRTEAGEALGEARTGTPINNGGAVQKLITSPTSGVAANKTILQAVTEAAETEISDQLQNELGETVGKLVVLTDEAASKAKLPSGGIYVQGSKKTKKGKSKKTYQPANLTVETLATAAQNLRRKGSQNLDNTAEDASSATGEGAKQVELAKEITEAIAEDNPEIAARNLQFIRNDAQERVNRLVGNLLKTENENQAPDIAKRITQILGGKTKIAGKEFDDITQEQIMISVRAALSEAVKKNTIKSFDETSSQVKTVRELMQKAGVPEESITRIVSTIRSNTNSLVARETLGKIISKSTDPKDVGETLGKAFRTDEIRNVVTQELGEETGNVYVTNIERALRELQLLSKSAAKSEVTEAASKAFVPEFLKNSIWYGAIVSSPVTAAGLTVVRSLNASGNLEKYAKSTKIQKAVAELIDKEPERVAAIVSEELKKSSYANGRIMEKLVRRLGIVAGVDEDKPKVISDLASSTGEEFVQENGNTSNVDRESSPNTVVSSLGRSTGTFTLEN